MHPKADTTSHGRAPTRGCADLPHWRSAIRSKDGQYRILPRGAALGAISGARHRILLATGAAAPPGLAGNVQCHVFAGAALPTKTYCNAPISADAEAFAAFEALGSSAAPCGPCPGAGKCCRAERVGAGAADADMQRERCCTGAYFAQKWWRICFGGVWDVCRVRDAKQQLGAVASCPAAGKCCRWEQRGPGAAGAELQRERCCIGACAAQKQWRICFRRNFNA